MGFGHVISGGEGGRYTVEIDYGESWRLQYIDLATAAIASLSDQLVAAQDKLAVAEVKEAEQQARIDAEVEAYIARYATLPAGSPQPSTAGIDFEKQKLTKLQVAHQPLRTLIDALKFDRAEAQRQLNIFNAVQGTGTRQAWCVDFTEDREPGALVGVLEIPGEPDLVVLPPGMRSWVPQDGLLRARELQRPDQAFLNAAITPGVLKWKPTYRWGEITAMDDATQTCTVALGSHSVTNQRLGVNQTSTVDGVPVEYMECGYSVFEVGDRVVIRFQGQAWDSPKVIGFLDNPRPCNWVCRGEGLILPGGNGILGGLIFESAMRAAFDAALTLHDAGTLDVECRVTGGSWLDTPGAWFPLTWNGVHYTGDFGQAFSTVGTATLDLVRYSDDDEVALCSVSPPFTESGPSTDRNVAEFVIRVDGQIIMNVAMTDRGASTIPENYRDGSARTRGGISILTGSYPVAPLDYTLLIDE